MIVKLIFSCATVHANSPRSSVLSEPNYGGGGSTTGGAEQPSPEQFCTFKDSEEQFPCFLGGMLIIIVMNFLHLIFCNSLYNVLQLHPPQY